MKIICIGNYKGGVGKTTTTLHLAAQLANRNKCTLVINIDTQASMSTECFRNNKEYLYDVASDLNRNREFLNYFMYVFLQLPYQNIIDNSKYNITISNKIEVNNGLFFDFIPSSCFGLSNILDDMILKFSNSTGSIMFFYWLLSKEIFKKYDYILVDCPPNNNVLTESIFLISDYLLIPTIMDPLSKAGIEHYLNTISKTYEKYFSDSFSLSFFDNIFKRRSLPFTLDNCSLNDIGILETMRYGTQLTENSTPAVYRQQFENSQILYTTKIKELTGYSESIGNLKDNLIKLRHSDKHNDYIDFVEEFIKRV